MHQPVPTATKGAATHPAYLGVSAVRQQQATQTQVDKEKLLGLTLGPSAGAPGILLVPNDLRLATCRGRCPRRGGAGYSSQPASVPRVPPQPLKAQGSSL